MMLAARWIAFPVHAVRLVAAARSRAVGTGAAPAALAARLFAAVLGFSAAGLASAQALVDELGWAYAITIGPAEPPPVDDGTKYRLPGSDREFTLDQIRNRLGPADWFPGDHPSMPPIVASGRAQGAVWACGMCHYPNGMGRPENAGVAGLQKDYFVQQMLDFKNGLRDSAEPRKANTDLMIGFAKALTDAEIRDAAEYFSALPWTPWIEVIETDTVPRTRVLGGMHLAVEGAGSEPIGRRIVEMPKNTEHTELLRNPRSGFVAYVPKGSVERGRALAATGGGKTTQCGVCHGESFEGLALVPTLRGRSPSYIARQLADFKLGTRRGAWAPLMSGVVANLSADDILDLSAYLASLPPNE